MGEFIEQKKTVLAQASEDAMVVDTMGGRMHVRWDRGRKRRSPSPPSEPAVQFSRDGLSSQLFPHRDWRAN